MLDVENIVRAEAAENFERQDFTPSEAVAIKRTLEPEMKAEAQIFKFFRNAPVSHLVLQPVGGGQKKSSKEFERVNGRTLTGHSHDYKRNG